MHPQDRMLTSRKEFTRNKAASRVQGKLTRPPTPARDVVMTLVSDKGVLTGDTSLLWGALVFQSKHSPNAFSFLVMLRSYCFAALSKKNFPTRLAILDIFRCTWHPFPLLSSSSVEDAVVRPQASLCSLPSLLRSDTSTRKRQSRRTSATQCLQTPENFTYYALIHHRSWRSDCCGCGCAPALLCTVVEAFACPTWLR